MQEDNSVFHKTIGAIIANMIAVEYNGYMSVIYNEMGKNYLRNKCDKAAKAEQEVIDRLSIANKDVKVEIEKMVKFNSDLIFDITAMDPDKQKRVRNLVDKIKKETNGKG